MFGIFTEGRDGFNWMANNETLDGAKAIAEDFRDNADVDLVLVLPLVHFIDVVWERCIE